MQILIFIIILALLLIATKAIDKETIRNLTRYLLVLVILIILFILFLLGSVK